MYTMQRTQIYLSDDELGRLDRAGRTDRPIALAADPRCHRIEPTRTTWT